MVTDRTAVEIDPDLFADAEDYSQGPARLWREALCLLLKDAMSYHSEGKTPSHAKPYDLEQAYDDVVRCGPMLRWCCEWLDYEPEYVSEHFKIWCAREPGAESLTE